MSIQVASSTDSQATVKAAADGTLEPVNYELPETEDDGRFRSDAVESDISSRNQLLARLEELERAEKEELASLEPLTPEAAKAQKAVLREMGGTEEAEPTPATEEAEKAEAAQPSPGKQRLDEIEAEHPGITELCIAASRQMHPDLLALLDKSPAGAHVLSELATHPAGLQQILQFSLQEQAAMLTGRMWQIQKESKGGAAANPKAENRQILRPTKPVGGSLKSTVPLDELPYAEYRKIRDKQIKDRRR